MKLEQLAEVTAGITTKPGDVEPGAGTMHRVVQVRNIQVGAIMTAKDLKTVCLGKERRAERYVIDDGDILVAILGANPKMAAVAAHPKKLLAPGNGSASTSRPSLVKRSSGHFVAASLSRT